jgi:predicted MFS family arabinose efflux permease
VTSLALTMPKVRRDHRIDYLGAATIVAAVTSILLFTAWAGPAYGWTDPFSLALLGGGVLLTGLFLVVEFHAEEPIIPMRLFRNRVFTPMVIFAAIMGMAMFGGIIFLPVYLQVVQGMSPTESGLALLPMVAGLFATSISSGRLVTRTGRYRIYPILGAGVTGVGIALLSTLGVDTPYWQTATYFFVFGAGLGFTMQIVVTAVQNAVERRDMGSATSSVTFFRSMGAALGTAIFGAVLTTRLGHHLSASGAGGLLPTADESQIANNVQAIQALPAEVKAVVVDAWVRALHDVFVVALPIVTVAFVVAFFIPELTLRGAVPTRTADDDAETVMALE